MAAIINKLTRRKTLTTEITVNTRSPNADEPTNLSILQLQSRNKTSPPEITRNTGSPNADEPTNLSRLKLQSRKKTSPPETTENTGSPNADEPAKVFRLKWLTRKKTLLPQIAGNTGSLNARLPRSKEITGQIESWWQRRTPLERSLSTSLLFAILGVIIVFILFIYYNSTRYRELCATPQCMIEAKYLFDSMNFSVDPCDNFYQFACGQAEKRSIPKGELLMNILKELRQKVANEIIAFLAEPVLDADSKAMRLAKTIYSLCMDKTNIDQFGSEALLNLLKSMGGWPVLEGEGWDESSWEWTKLTSDLRKNGFGYKYIMEINPITILANYTNVIYLGEPLFYQRKEPYLKKDPEWNAYRNYMVEIAVLLGADRVFAEKDMAETHKFEFELENACAGSATTDKTVNIQYLIDTYPSIPWLEFLNNLLLLPFQLKEKEKLTVGGLKYIAKLEKIMTATSKRAQANYMMWRAIEAVIPYLPEKFKLAKISYETSIGLFIAWPIRHTCEREVSASLPVAVASEYLKRYVDLGVKRKAVDFVKMVKAGLQTYLAWVYWMTPSSRWASKRSTIKMSSAVAYPKELLKDNEIASIYEELEIDINGTFLEAKLNASTFLTTLEFKKLRGRFVKWAWYDAANVYEADIEYTHVNLLKVPAAILQGRFYSENRPNYLNFGLLGWLMGNELAGSFIHEGKDDDEDYRDLAKTAVYEREEQCLIDQYNGYTEKFTGLKVNGTRTFLENFADNGGVKVAYYGYQKWLTVNGEDLILPGFHDYSSNQMFWISAATLWCTAYRSNTSELRTEIGTNTHSAGEFRVIGSFSNNKMFASDFSCPRSSPMNPIEKCIV